MSVHNQANPGCERWIINVVGQATYSDWNPIWLKFVVGAALAGGVLVAILRAVRGGSK